MPTFLDGTQVSWAFAIGDVTMDGRPDIVTGAGEVFVSETVKGHLVGSGIAVSEQGIHVLKGVPDEWRLYAIED